MVGDEYTENKLARRLELTQAHQEDTERLKAKLGPGLAHLVTPNMVSLDRSAKEFAGGIVEVARSERRLEERARERSPGRG
ncbi:hypothetical protein [Ensifer sp. NM-2]|uniref:hypothetical protein n=1 Tax=Ensifer sp. NM-2 TaxID=2109730 RepID=UPI0011B1CC5B|nr:hypothetical protein [Ensifer sp. NM-2]